MQPTFNKTSPLAAQETGQSYEKQLTPKNNSVATSSHSPGLIQLPSLELKQNGPVEKPERSLLEQASISSLYDWATEAASLTSKRVSAAMSPVIETVTQKLADESLYVDIKNGITYAERELKKILSDYEETLSPVRKFAIYIGEKGSYLLVELKTAATPILEAAEKCIDACGKSIFGETLYGQIKGAVSGFVGKISRYIGNVIRSIYSAWNRQEEEREERQSRQKHASENLSLRREHEEAKKASGLISELKEKIEYFGENKERFLSVNILDDREKRDGILRNQPDSLRTTLAISRPVFDPFPSREVREERARDEAKIRE